jgi:hypothetical protein
MFPISDDTLTFREIANYWSGEINPSVSSTDLLRLLERAWWHGEVVGEAGLTRLTLLRVLVKNPERLNVVFLVEDVPRPSEIEQMINGDVIVDLRPRIVVPSGDADTWRDENCPMAYEALAHAQCLITDPTVGPALCGIKLNRAEFMKWLGASGYNLPTFWGAVEENDAATITQPTHVKRKRGRKPEKRLRVSNEMLRELKQGTLTTQQLQSMKEKELEYKYKVSRDTARSARDSALSEYNSRQIATNDK